MFSLIWQPNSQLMFIGMWMTAGAAMRRRIAQAVQRIILQLSADPQNAGESRDRGRRVMREAPVGVLFKVDAKRMRVRILQIWEY